MEKKFTSTDIQVCGQCHGVGGISIPGEVINYHTGEREENHFVLCALCIGTGLLKVTKQTTVTLTPHIPTKCVN